MYSVLATLRSLAVFALFSLSRGEYLGIWGFYIEAKKLWLNSSCTLNHLNLINRSHLTPLLKQWMEMINKVRDNTTHIINIAKSTYSWNSYQKDYDTFSMILANSKDVRQRKIVSLYWSILNWFCFNYIKEEIKFWF